MNSYKEFLRDLCESDKMMFKDPDSLRKYLLDQPEVKQRSEVAEQIKQMRTLSEMQKYMFKLFIQAFQA